MRLRDVLSVCLLSLIPMLGSTNPQITFDKDGFLNVNGKPFFPIGIYTLQNKDGKNHDAVMAEGKAAGFNMTVFYAYTPETVTPLLDAAARNGILAFIYPTIPFSIEGGKTLTDEAIVKDIELRKNHPALLGWYVVDEPEGIGKGSVEEVLHRYKLIKKTDPKHPCSLVVMSPQAAEKYRLCTDIMWIDPYPIPYRPVTYVTDCVSGAIKAVGKDKPVWAVLQAFDWNVWKTGKVDKVHRPTPEEERCMTYLALVHGAKGIIYWAHLGSRYYIHDYPLHWATVKKLAGEMKLLTPALLARSIEGTLAVSPVDAPIDTMVKQVGDAFYVLAVNHNSDACKATFNLKGLQKSARVEVVFESRTLEAKDGIWSDNFAPLEVHVYKIK
ncbi:MAG: hypothetical protein K6T99_07215 [Armatimonadetes bacterium]|nr:hypothetical protein [Armatimonadota bacterium]